MTWHLPFRYARESIFPYIHNRWISPSHKIIIKHPEYHLGSYHDTDDIMLYGMFQLLVDYVEIECAVFPCVSEDQNRLFETPWQRVYRVISELPGVRHFIPPGRNARRGLHHLRWAMKLGKESPSQAASAKEVFELYRFWKHTRLGRVNPWTLYSEIREHRDWTRPLSKTERRFLNRAHAVEERYHREDEQMLIRLIKRRRDLWT
jgi:hypothetical protein